MFYYFYVFFFLLFDSIDTKWYTIQSTFQRMEELCIKR